MARSLDTKLGLDKTRVLGAILGGLLPDMPAYVFFFYNTVILGVSQQQLWDVLYFDSAWTPYVTLSHSFILWPALLLLGHVVGKKLLFWIAAGGILHSFMDFTVHVDDAYRHLWPLTDWKFESPLSYWDPNHYGNIVGSLDTIAVLLLLVFIMKRTESIRMQKTIIGISVIYITMTIVPYIVFNLYYA